MAAQQQPEFVDSFSNFSAGINSGVLPVELPRTQLAYATNATVRGLYVKPRPSYQQINLLPDVGVNLGTLRFQGACYYDPDFGQESIVAQIGGRLYQFIPDTANNASVYDRTIQSVVANGVVETYDTNPAGVQMAWLWQSENYVIVNDGQSRPIIFNGIASRRAVSPNFIGTVAESFVLPPVGSSVGIVLSAPYLDAVGQFIQISPLNYYPFLMQVTAINGYTLSATNIDGWTIAGVIIPIAAPVESVSNPTYFGTILTQFQLPSQGSNITFNVSQPFNGKIGDSIFLTDGTGPLTTAQLTVVSFTSGTLSTITATNVTGLPSFIIPVGFPILSQMTVASDLPIGRMGAYVQGRNWISSTNGKTFVASDLVGSSSGTEQFNYRDAVLKFSQNTSLFPVPGGAGQINCIIALSSLDASLGQGPLQILCDNDIFTCSAPVNAAEWAMVTTPILSESAIGFGGVGQNAATLSNADLILKSRDGTIHSFRLSREDFNEWGQLPISQEVNRIIQQENGYLFSNITFASFDNRALISCAPINSPGGIYSQGIIALDYDISSSSQGKLPSVYDGVWKGLNVLQLITDAGRPTIFNGVQRQFAVCLNITNNQIELWEILTEGTADSSPAFKGGTQPIDWSFESPVVFGELKGKAEDDLVKLEDGAIWISNLIGQATVKAYYRPDYDSCWHEWTCFSVCASLVGNPAPQYRVRLGLGKPSSSDCDPTVNKEPIVGRFFQIRFEITGSLTFMEAVFKASPVQQPDLAPKAINEGVQDA